MCKQVFIIFHYDIASLMTTLEAITKIKRKITAQVEKGIVLKTQKSLCMN